MSEFTILGGEDYVPFITDIKAIDLVEFSTGKEANNKKFVYLYGRVVSLELICEEIKLEKDW